MAATEPLTKQHLSNMKYIKTLAESPGLTSIPSTHAFTTNLHDHAALDPEEPIPIIDFSQLTSGDPNQRSKTIHDLGKACQDWGFFMVTNHGVPESLIDAMIEATGEFFNLTEEDKQEFQAKHLLDPISCGTSINTSIEKVFYWRDYLKVFVHPEFHSPTKPIELREVTMEYSKRARFVARELLKAISESLGLEANYIEKALNLDSGLQIFIANLYPPCPQPELAMGLPSHSDHGLLTLLIQNRIDGLQLQHNGKWVNVHAPPYSFLVNTADHIEILSNGKYKSVLHRAVVNNTKTRISIAMAHGPSLESVVSPAQELEDRDGCRKYVGMKYREYLEFHQSHKIDGKTKLDRVRVDAV